MTDNIIATERKTNGYYIVSYLFFFLWLLYCLSIVFLSVAIILSVICFSFCGFYIVLIATERKTNDRQYNSHRKKNNLLFFLLLLYCLSFVFIFVAIILSVICISFCGYYIVCHSHIVLHIQTVSVQIGLKGPGGSMS
jgi:hypothetical protein